MRHWISYSLALAAFISASSGHAENIAPLFTNWSAVQARYELLYSPGLKRVDVQLSEISEGVAGFTLLAALADRAEDVEVRLLLDRHYSGRLDPKLLEYLRRKGVDVREYHRVDLREYSRVLKDVLSKPLSYAVQLAQTVNNRMHDKGMLFEFESGELKKIGGDLNADDRYFQQTSTRPWKKGEVAQSNQYIGFDYFLEGPRLADYRKYLDELNESVHVMRLRPIAVRDREWTRFEQETDRLFAEKLANLRDYIAKLDQQGKHWRREMIEGVEARFLHDDLTDREHGPNVSRELLAEMTTARAGVRLGSPFGSLTDKLMTAMRALRLRNVPVEFYTSSSEQNESTMVARVFNDLVPKLMGMGVDIYQTAHRMLHAKIFRKDSDITAVTSWNTDDRSDKQNLEIGWLVKSEVFAKRMDRWLDRLQRLSHKRVTVEDPHPRLRPEKLKDRLLERVRYHAAPHLKALL